MIEFVIYRIPYWIWAIPSAAVLIGIFLFLVRHFGLRNALAAAAVIGSGLIAQLAHQRGRQVGWNQRIEKENADARKVEERAARARRDVAAERGKLRDDDGFKRR